MDQSWKVQYYNIMTDLGGTRSRPVPSHILTAHMVSLDLLWMIRLAARRAELTLVSRKNRATSAP